jgi:galactokinase
LLHGRVNLIGEHTDYNGGHVFPCALTIGTYAIARKNNDKKLRFYSMNFENIGIIESSIDELKYNEKEDWVNYPKSAIWSMKENKYNIDTGMDFGTIPNGAGLSSSASIEVLTCFVLKDMFYLDVDMIKIALLSQMAENKYVGVNCGIMDQFVIANGKEDCAIFLDTSNLEYKYAPIRLKDSKIVIMNTNKKRGLRRF